VIEQSIPVCCSKIGIPNRIDNTKNFAKSRTRGKAEYKKKLALMLQNRPTTKAITRDHQPTYYGKSKHYFVIVSARFSLISRLA